MNLLSAASYLLWVMPAIFGPVEPAHFARAEKRVELADLRPSEGTTNICSINQEAARRRCAASCGALGYSFVPGSCGANSICRCGTGGVIHIPVFPKEP